MRKVCKIIFIILFILSISQFSFANEDRDLPRVNSIESPVGVISIYQE